jgi:hypothetical protein
MDFDPRPARLSSAQVITIVPKMDTPEMKVYTVESLEELVELRLRLIDPQIAEFIADIQVVHWDENPQDMMEG